MGSPSTALAEGEREAASAFNLFLLPRLLSSSWAWALCWLETPEVRQQAMAKGTSGHDLFKLLQERQELSRGKCENGQPGNTHPKSRKIKIGLF